MSRMCLLDTKRVLAVDSRFAKKKKFFASKLYLFPSLWEKSNVLGSRSCASFSSSSDDDDEFWVVRQFLQKESREQYRECE